MSNRNYIICVNGPGSSGKSSAALEVAQSLKFSFMSTGNVYRSYAWALQKHNISSYTKDICLGIMKMYNFEYVGKSVFYNGVDISNDIGYEELAFKTASLAKKSWYRNFINEVIIIPYITNKSIVLEGRGLKEIVPNADLDIYIKSTIFARASRRMRQYKHRLGVHEVTIDQIYKQIQKRDDLDMHRKIAPLVPYADSKIINNTALKRVDTVKRILSLFHKRFPEVPVDWTLVSKEYKKIAKKNKK